MADNISVGVANSVLGELLSGTAFAGFTTPYIQLHVGAPGVAGTSSIAGNSTRQPTGTWTAPSNGSTANTTAINWTSVSTTETYTHISLWSAVTAGTFINSGTIAASPVTAGQNFQIPAAGITVSLPTAS